MDERQNPAPRRLLVEMLQEAAKLEHCLLNNYLFAACSLKSTPQEFEHIDGLPNRRRAFHFERVRVWKQSILHVAHEEMRHLHYVQCMIRALGERPCFELPDRDKDGVWIIPNWRIRVGKRPASETGMAVPVGPVSEEALQRFVLFESTDSLQEQDPFGSDITALFKMLYDFELDLRFETMLVNMPAGPERDSLKAQLKDLYTKLTPVERKIEPEVSLAILAKLPSLEETHFQSIGDFYRLGILPLYQQAFQEGWVVVNDRDLVDEQLNPNYAAEGALPVGPVGRTARFSRFTTKNTSDALTNYKTVQEIVEEIVDEGEGFSLFVQRAKKMLSKIAEIGTAGFLKARSADTDPDATPGWLYDAQLIRNSHLYAFAMILQELREEQALAKTVGVSFQPAREPLRLLAPGFAKLAEDIPTQFNACYLAMLAWLARMYEPRHWAADTPRRVAIEMVATWPLMSLAIRPFLELASFFPINSSHLFRAGSDHLPKLPIWAQELCDLYQSSERSEAINRRMDALVTQTLKATAGWAAEQLWMLEASGLPSHERKMIATRLKALATLDEFERQFPYRVAGGYSDRAPSLTYQNLHPNSSRFEEDPTTVNPLFSDSLVLRLRFRGWGLVQLATDPDPPTDESGCTGTIMLHPADGDRILDRALVWQDFEPERNIRRPVAETAPPLGVNCIEAAVLATAFGRGANAGYMPLQVMSSTGAVQTSGVQQILQISGLNPIASVLLGETEGFGRAVRVYLESKNDVHPFLNGDNHLIWQDGEPIDPFVLSLYVDDARQGSPSVRLVSREVYNDNRTIRQMEPYQRLLTHRAPVGFDTIRNLPGWARTPETQPAFMPGFPQTFLSKRCRSLTGQLQSALTSSKIVDSIDQDIVDQIVSLAERLFLVAQPRGTTGAWLRVLLHYGHTVSGNIDVGADTSVLEGLSKPLGLKLDVAPSGTDRNAVNSRWLISYTKGMMDVDAVSDFVYGELYIPLAVTGKVAAFRRAWSFPATMKDAVIAFAGTFGRPFWMQYKIDSSRRTVDIPGLDPRDPKNVALTETVIEQSPAGYRYSQTGFPNLSSCEAIVEIGDDGVLTHFVWRCRFEGTDQQTIVRYYTLLADTADKMEAALEDQFKIRPLNKL
jgi:hypothetical protein